ncbi:hypothetical protein HK405_008993, partial [Cladochytrium tenue]
MAAAAAQSAATAAAKASYDYLVIGGGSGGVASARRAALHGARVAIVENSCVPYCGPTCQPAHPFITNLTSVFTPPRRALHARLALLLSPPTLSFSDFDRWGGTCVNVGCVPKKIMWSTASIAEMLHEAKGYGFDLSVKGFAWDKLKTKRDAYIVRLNNIYDNNLAKEGVDRIIGTARFVAKDAIEVNGTTYTAKHILIATGSRAWIPNIPGARELGVTSDGFFELTTLPKKVAIVGAGYIAIELAGIFNALGAEVSLFIRHSEFLRTFDPIIRQTLMTEYRKAGIQVVTEAAILGVENRAATAELGKKDLALSVRVGGAAGAAESHDGFQELIWAIGREANVDHINLDVTGVQLNKDGFVVVDEYQDTATSGIHALGDVCGVAMLTPVAIAAGRRLSDRLFGGKAGAKLDYANIPSVIFSHPTAGS